MPDKENNNFDLQLRSLLEDAEVKPSRRVWKAVSARLDEDAAVKAAPLFPAWVKWAGAGLAFAAALVMGIFLQPIPTYKHIQQQPENLLAQASMPEPALSEVTSTPSDSKPERSRKVTTLSNIGEVAAIEEVTGVKEEILSEPAAEPEEKREVREDRTKVSEPEPLTLPDWGEEEVAERLPVQLFIEGALAGNESEFTPTHTIGYMTSPAYTTLKTGITELGDSSFGIPFTVGIGARFYLTEKLSLGTGIDYSLLTRSFEGRYTEVDAAGDISRSETGTVMHSMHYVGVPLDVFYDFISGNKIKFYAYGGGAAEYCVANKYSMYSQKIDFSDPVKKLQWSVGAGIGVEFRLTDFLGIYLDPGARYYFNCGQPDNVRTKHPLLVNFDAGLRFDF